MTVQDSAGVRIVESAQPHWGEREGWQVARDPTLSLGAIQGDDALSFDRLSGVYLLDERITVLDEGAGLVRRFEREGTPLGTFGGQGQGPGEFQGLEFLGVRRDSLWLFDRRQRRTTVLDPESMGFRVVSVAMENAALGAVGLLPDRGAVIAADLSFSAAVEDDLPPGLQRFEAAYVLVDDIGRLADTLLITLGGERILQYSAETVQVIRLLLGRQVSHAVRGADIVQGTQESYQIGVYSDEGVLQSLVRRTDGDVAIDEEAYRAALESRLLAAPEEARPGLRALWADRPRPESRPAYSRFLVDSEGFLWVQDFDYQSEADSWAVFDREGVWLGTVDLPVDFSPTQILADEVVGIWRDELEVEYARVYSLMRSVGAPLVLVAGAADRATDVTR